MQWWRSGAWFPWGGMSEDSAEAVVLHDLHAAERGAHVLLIADRIRFTVSLFEAPPHLDPFVVAAFLEPDTLLRRGPRRAAPWPPQRRGAEVLKPAFRWDEVGRLQLHREEDVSVSHPPRPGWCPEIGGGR